MLILSHFLFQSNMHKSIHWSNDTKKNICWCPKHIPDNENFICTILSTFTAISYPEDYNGRVHFFLNLWIMKIKFSCFICIMVWIITYPTVVDAFRTEYRIILNLIFTRKEKWHFDGEKSVNICTEVLSTYNGFKAAVFLVLGNCGFTIHMSAPLLCKRLVFNGSSDTYQDSVSSKIITFSINKGKTVYFKTVLLKIKMQVIQENIKNSTQTN